MRVRGVLRRPTPPRLRPRPAEMPEGMVDDFSECFFVFESKIMCSNVLSAQ